MILKSCLLVSCLVATPVVLVSSTQDPESLPTRRGTCAVPTTDDVTTRLHAEVERLRAELERQRERAARAEETVQRAMGELREALDMLLQRNQRDRERNCSPSRDLLTQHEWLRDRGHIEHAERAIDQIAAAQRNEPSRLNRLAWDLMTDDETAGRYDVTAFALAQRIERSGRDLPHQLLDTIALAYFLNHRAEAAVEFQRRALQAHDSGDYRRRLRTYEAAWLAIRAAAPAQPAEIASAAGADEPAAMPQVALDDE